LYGCVTSAIREQDKSRVISGTIKFMKKMAKYTWMITKPIKILYQSLKLTQLKRKSKISAISEYNIFGEWTQTNTIMK